jgi:hypothetical protein
MSTPLYHVGARIIISKSITAFIFQPISFEMKFLKFENLFHYYFKFVSCEDYERLQ